MTKKYLIDRMEVTKNRLEVVACKKFKKQYLLDDFFVEYDDDVDLNRIDPSIVQIPFILNVIPIIWVSGEEYYIKSLDEDLARSLQEVREVFRTMYPDLAWSGELIPVQLVSNARVAHRTGGATTDYLGVLFSGGVDSVCTSFRHKEIRQLLITIWGSSIALENEKGWTITKDQCKQFGRIHGHDNAFIKSNFQRFLYTSRLNTFSDMIPSWWTHVQHGLGLTGLTAPLLLQRMCTRLLIASTHTQDFKLGWGSDYSIDNKLRWAGISVVHDSFDWTRQAKLRFINSFCESQQKIKPLLKVCMSDTRTRGDNCGRCKFCLQTITGLLIEGEHIHDYGFDISIQEAVKLSREKFRERSMPIKDQSDLFLWKDVQARAREVLSCSNDGDSIESDLRSYFQWLSSLDLDEYQIHYQKKSQPNYIIRVMKEYLKKLLKHAPILGGTYQKRKEQYHYRSACKK